MLPVLLMGLSPGLGDGSFEVHRSQSAGRAVPAARVEEVREPFPTSGWGVEVEGEDGLDGAGDVGGTAAELP